MMPLRDLGRTGIILEEHSKTMVNPDMSHPASTWQPIVESLPPNPSMDTHGLMTVEAVQKTLNRSRASVYRYANTDATLLNPPYDPQRLNPEVRSNKDEPLLFHPNEVARFAREVLGIRPVVIEVQPPAETLTHQLLREILQELRSIHELLKTRS